MDLPTLLGALQFLAFAGLITVCVFLFRHDIPVRAIRALSRRIRGERGPSPAHPAAKAARRCSCDACTAELSPVDFARWERDVRSGRPL